MPWVISSLGVDLEGMNTVVFPGIYSSLEGISEFARDACQEAGLDDTACYAVELAVDEACSNIIDHAYGAEGLGDIEITSLIDEQGLTIIMRDFGKPFDPSKVRKPRLKVPLNQVDSSGLGVFLMHRMMDEVNYEFTRSNGNILTMVKYRHNS